jgi:hypothetical protein
MTCWVCESTIRQQTIKCNLNILGPREGETSSHDPFGDPKIPSDVDDWRHVETVHTNISVSFTFACHEAVRKGSVIGAL